jgi:hypothetical protein
MLPSRKVYAFTVYVTKRLARALPLPLVTRLSFLICLAAPPGFAGADRQLPRGHADNRAFPEIV